MVRMTALAQLIVHYDVDEYGNKEAFQRCYSLDRWQTDMASQLAVPNLARRIHAESKAPSSF